MNGTDRIYALLVDANPVLDPDTLPATAAGRYLQEPGRDEMQTREAMRPLTTEPPKKRPRWIPVLVGAAIVIAAIAVPLALLGGDDDSSTTAPAATGPPTVVFDGELATYTGPLEFEAGEITFRFVNDHDTFVSLNWARMTDDHPTLEEARREYEEYRAETGDQSVPSYVTSYGDMEGVDPGTTASITFDLSTPAPYQLYIWDGWRIAAFAAAHIEVVAAD